MNPSASQNQIPAISEEARMFLGKLIEEKNFENLNPELKETMIQSLYPRLNAFIMTAIAKALKAKDAEAIDKLYEKENFSQEDLMKFLQEHLPNIQEITAQAMLDFKDTYLNA